LKDLGRIFVRIQKEFKASGKSGSTFLPSKLGCSLLYLIQFLLDFICKHKYLFVYQMLIYLYKRFNLLVFQENYYNWAINLVASSALTGSFSWCWGISSFCRSSRERPFEKCASSFCTFHKSFIYSVNFFIIHNFYLLKNR
jgi:hypothetical protein